MTFFIFKNKTIKKLSICSHRKSFELCSSFIEKQKSKKESDNVFI